MNPSDKLIVALDVPSLKEAEALVKKLSPTVSFFKVGMELFTSVGPDAVHLVHKYKARVFLDLKFHDIPNTVGAACATATRLGVFMMNVHAIGGKNMMISAIQAVHETATKEKLKHPKLLAVTVLTSMKDVDLKEVGVKNKVVAEVEALAMLTQQSGLDGVVASGQEISLIRAVAGKNFLIVTPGVRPAWASHGDQKRIVTPHTALKDGADFIVVGRPITAHANPLEAAELILKEMKNG